MNRNTPADARIITGAEASGRVLTAAEGLSFWGGVDPETGRIIDAHHPNHGASVAGRILLMPTSRGSCSGSGVLLQLALNGYAPAALVFCEKEEVLTLGAIVSDRVFSRPVVVLQVPRAIYDRLAIADTAEIAENQLHFENETIGLGRVSAEDIKLTDDGRALLAGDKGHAAQVAMDVLCRMAASDGAEELLKITRGHIDGCILAHDANLIFAEKLAEMGAKVTIPTTINAISVDRNNWHSQGVPHAFGDRASRLADAYVRMGARPTFTCAPYLLDGAPKEGEPIGWSESNAVLYANSVLGARTAKHPDYLDLFIAMCGRAPATGVYTDDGRRPEIVVDIDAPDSLADESFWPIIGWQVGRVAPNGIPLLTGLEHLHPGTDDLKALCAAFATTSGAPMLHIAGHTPEAHFEPTPGAPSNRVSRGDIADAWRELNRGGQDIDLVAIGSPHASLKELQKIASLFGDRRCSSEVQMIVTLGRDVLREAVSTGLVDRLQGKGARLLPDLCWCSITEPVFPAGACGLMTNSGKYAHYAHGLSGLHARLGSLSDCVDTAVSGVAPAVPPDWATGIVRLNS